jgi:hypothetical protein
LNNTITLRRKTIKELNLTVHQTIDARITKLVSPNQANAIFNQDKIDLLYFVPKNNRLGLEILIDEFKKDNEIWLKIWYCFNRGSCTEIELKIFLII